MKKSLTVLLTVVLLLISTLPVFAASHNAPMQPKPFILTGNILSIEGSAITIEVISSWFAQQGYESPVTLQTTGDTRFLLRNEDGVATKIALEDLVTDQNVSVLVEFVGDDWVAIRVTADAVLTHE